MGVSFCVTVKTMRIFSNISNHTIHQFDSRCNLRVNKQVEESDNQTILKCELLTKILNALQFLTIGVPENFAADWIVTERELTH